MPIYEFTCSKCGKSIEELRALGDIIVPLCPDCGTPMERVFSAPARIVVRHKENLPLGNKSRGKYISSEKGRRDIFVPSFGALEKEEVDYIVEAEQEKEDERIRKIGNKPKRIHRQIEAIANETRKAPKGERAKRLKEIMGGIK